MYHIIINIVGKKKLRPTFPNNCVDVRATVDNKLTDCARWKFEFT